MTTLKSYIDAIPPQIPTSLSQLSGAIPPAKLGTFSGDVTGSGYTLTLVDTGVTPGSYANANFTVDSKGRVTAVSTGTAGGITSVFGRSGSVTAQSGDYSIGQIAGAGALAALSGIGGLITAGSGVTLGGTGTIASPYSIGVTGTPTVEVTTTPYQMAPNTRYIVNMATLCTLLLPTTATLGSSILVDGKGAGGWKVAQNAGQTIHTYSDTTTGTAGSLSSSSRYDNVVLICITANTDFEATARNGNLVLT